MTERKIKKEEENEYVTKWWDEEGRGLMSTERRNAKEGNAKGRREMREFLIQDNPVEAKDK